MQTKLSKCQKKFVYYLDFIFIFTRREQIGKKLGCREIYVYSWTGKFTLFVYANYVLHYIGSSREYICMYIALELVNCKSFSFFFFCFTETDISSAVVIILLLASLNSCTNPWVYLAFSGSLLNQMRVSSCIM